MGLNLLSLISRLPVFGKSVQNANLSFDCFNNVVKGFQSITLGSNTPANFNINQYPTGVLLSTLGGNVGIDPSYFGHYNFAWTGVGAFEIIGPPLLIYSGGNGVYGITPTASGFTTGTTEWINNGSQNCEFAFGVLITSVTTSGGGLVQFGTPANSLTNINTGATFKFNNMTGLGTGPNVNGSWTITKVDAQTMTLQASSAYAGLVSITSTGGPGTQSEGIYSSASFSFQFPVSIPTYGTVTYTMSDFLICQTGNYTDLVTNGHQITQSCINALKSLKPRYLRFMDMMAAQNFYSDYNFGLPEAAMTYEYASGSVNRAFFPSLFVTQSSGTGDAIVAPNPGYQTGAYVDGEMVQFQAIGSSSGYSPTLELGSRGVVPLFGVSFIPLYLTLTGTPTNGDVISIVFTAPYFSGGVYTFTYTVNTSSGHYGPDTSLQNLGANINFALTNDTTLMSFAIVFDYPGAGVNRGYYVPSLGTLTVTSSTSGSATETCHPGTFGATNTIVSGNFYSCIYNGILGGFVIVGNNSGMPVGIPKEVIAELCTRVNCGAYVNFPMTYTLASYQAFGAWAATSGIPFVAVETANEVWNTSANPASQYLSLGACLGFPTASYFYCSSYSYYGIQIATLQPAFAAGYVGAGGNRSNLMLILQCRADDTTYAGNASNQCTLPFRMNGGLATATPASGTWSISGTTLTITSGQVGGFLYPGFVITGSGVTTTRVVKQLTFGIGSNPPGGYGTYQVDVSQTVGPVTMTATNAAYAAAGGPGGTATSTAYNAFPTRPIDLVDAIGYAVYPSGGLIRGGVGYMSGTVAQNAAILTAAFDYGNGDLADALAAWDADLYNGNTPSGSPFSFAMTAYISTANGRGYCNGYETLLQVNYDGARPSGKANLGVIQYEGGPQQSLSAGSPSANGTIASSSPAALNAEFTSLGWTTFPTYGPDNLTVATNLVNLNLAYYVSSVFSSRWLGFLHSMATVHAARPLFCPAQFGFEGQSNQITASIGVPFWGIYSGLLNSQLLGNGQALTTYNAGG